MKHVTVLRGGPSGEYDVSLRSGAAVLKALSELGYPTKDITISKSGEWLESGMVRSPETTLNATDVVFIALHGEFGEDGQIQRMLQRKHIPFTGSRALPSAIAFNKELTKRSLYEHNILMPKHRRVSRGNFETLNDHRAICIVIFVKMNNINSHLGNIAQIFSPKFSFLCCFKTHT